MIRGSLVLHSNSEPEVLHWFTHALRGQHTPGRSHGSWFMQALAYEDEMVSSVQVFIPQRDKAITATSFYKPMAKAKNDSVDYESALSKTDAENLNLTQFGKLGEFAKILNGPDFVILNTEGTHGSWSFISKTMPLYFLGIKDTDTIHLLWSDEDLVEELKHRYPARFVYYRFPTLLDSHLFVNTQAVCAKWWRWKKAFNGDPLRCFNALEAMLFKAR